MVEEFIFFNYGVGALPAKRARMYCCSGYRTTPNQGGTRFYSLFQRSTRGYFLKLIRARLEIQVMSGFGTLGSI